MIRLKLYRRWVRFPQFKGKARVDNWIKNRLFQKQVFRLPSGNRMVLDPLEWAQRELLSEGQA